MRGARRIAVDYRGCRWIWALERVWCPMDPVLRAASTREQKRRRVPNPTPARRRCGARVRFRWGLWEPASRALSLERVLEGGSYVAGRDFSPKCFMDVGSGPAVVLLHAARLHPQPLECRRREVAEADGETVGAPAHDETARRRRARRPQSRPLRPVRRWPSRIRRQSLRASPNQRRPIRPSRSRRWWPGTPIWGLASRSAARWPSNQVDGQLRSAIAAAALCACGGSWL